MSDSREILNNEAIRQAELFEEDNVRYTEALIVSKVKRRYIMWFYTRLVAMKKLTDIKKINEEEKWQWWEISKEIVQDRLDYNDTKNFAICMYTLSFLVEYKKTKQ